MVTSYHACLSDNILKSRSKEYFLLEPCEVLIEKEWILEKLTPWIDSIDEMDVSL